MPGGGGRRVGIGPAGLDGHSALAGVERPAVLSGFPSGSLAVIFAVIAPVVALGVPGLKSPSIAAMVSLTDTRAVPPCPSSTVTVKVSVLTAVLALGADAAMRAAAVGV